MQHTVDAKFSNASDLTTAVHPAVARAVEAALLHGSCGILVTRHDYQRFSVEVTSEVPFGVIVEKDDCLPVNASRQINADH